jgi:FSR family fosmidomycin resistance protein-like MFS transporter
MVSGLFYGFAFGMGGLGSALLGNLADHTIITYVYNLCAFTFDWDHFFCRI